MIPYYQKHVVEAINFENITQLKDDSNEHVKKEDSKNTVKSMVQNDYKKIDPAKYKKYYKIIPTTLKKNILFWPKGYQLSALKASLNAHNHLIYSSIITKKTYGIY